MAFSCLSQKTHWIYIIIIIIIIIIMLGTKTVMPITETA